MFLVLGTTVILLTYALASGVSTVSVRTVVSSAAPVAVKLLPGDQEGPPIPRPSGKIVSDAVGHQRSVDLARLLAVSWVVLAITAVVSAVLGWFIAGRVLRPLREMTAVARTISAGNLGRRLALTGPDDEFKRLGDTVDDLLGRLQTSFETQRRFVASASHELRTPLTLERTLLQVALADPDASAVTLRATCEELLASGRDQERLLEALLTLTSSERGLDHREPLDLATLVAAVLLAPRPEIEHQSLQIASTLHPAPISGDRALLERLIANLVDNAVGYNRPDGLVEIRTGSQGERALLTVTNTGPVVPAGELERLFEPFQRVGGRRTAAADGHHGLGLSIVRAIAAAHDASVAAEPQRDGGLAVTVSFARVT
jgi:signal transduction histidine kinase